MKKDILKVCSLGLVVTMLFTGCVINEGKVTKIKKNDEITYSSDSEIIEDYYSIELYRFNNTENLNKEYYNQINYRNELPNSTSDVEIITETNNIYEAVITLEPGTMMSAETNYLYVLIIKDDKDYIVLEETSTKKDKKNMKKIGSILKEKYEKKSSVKDVFDSFAKERNLNLSNDVFDNDFLNSMGCYSATSGTNSYIVTITNEKGKVETVEIETIPVGNNQVKVLLVGKNSNKKTIWSLDLGISPEGVGTEYSLLKGSKYVYLCINGIVEAREIETGKKVWTTSDQIGWYVDKMVESDNALFIFTGAGKETITIINLKDGKTIYPDKQIQDYLVSEQNEDDYYDLKYSTAKIEGNYLVVEVTDDNNPYSVTQEGKEYEEELIGYLKINTKNYEIKFEKVK